MKPPIFLLNLPSAWDMGLGSAGFKPPMWLRGPEHTIPRPALQSRFSVNLPVEGAPGGRAPWQPLPRAAFTQALTLGVSRIPRRAWDYVFLPPSGPALPVFCLKKGLLRICFSFFPPPSFLPCCGWSLTHAQQRLDRGVSPPPVPSSSLYASSFILIFETGSL